MSKWVLPVYDEAGGKLYEIACDTPEAAETAKARRLPGREFAEYLACRWPFRSREAQMSPRAYTTTALVFALAALNGCDQQPENNSVRAAPVQQQPSEIGRFALLPAENGPTIVGSWPVWRLDTKTGDLQFCMDDQSRGNQNTLPELMCSNTAAAEPSGHLK